MNSRIFAPSIRPPRAPRHEAGSVPRHLIPCRYLARGHCSRGDSCMFSHSFNDSVQSRGLQGDRHTIVPFWNNRTTFSPQPHAEHHYGTRYSSLSPQLIRVPPPSPSSSSVTMPDEASSFSNLHLPEGSSPIDSISSTLAIAMRASIAANGETSYDEFLSPSTDAHFVEFYPLPSHSPTYLTPVPYVQRGFGYRDNRARGRDNRRRRTKAKLITSAKTNPSRETAGSPSAVVLQRTAHRKPGTTSESDSTSVKPHQETWRVIGGGVMLGTVTNATSRRKSKRLQSCTRVIREERVNGLCNESLGPNRSADESLEFSNLVASVKLTINRPPLPDIIERPKSSFSLTKAPPLAALFTHAEVA